MVGLVSNEQACAIDWWRYDNLSKLLTLDGIIEDQDWHTYSLDVVFSGEACGQEPRGANPQPAHCQDPTAMR